MAFKPVPLSQWSSTKKAPPAALAPSRLLPSSTYTFGSKPVSMTIPERGLRERIESNTSFHRCPKLLKIQDRRLTSAQQTENIKQKPESHTSFAKFYKHNLKNYIVILKSNSEISFDYLKTILEPHIDTGFVAILPYIKEMQAKTAAASSVPPATPSSLQLDTLVTSWSRKVHSPDWSLEQLQFLMWTCEIVTCTTLKTVEKCHPVLSQQCTEYVIKKTQCVTAY